MTINDLITMYDYGYWANGKLMEGLSHLTDEQFTRVVEGSHGSIRNTMVHILSAEWGWLERCGGTARGAALNASNYPTVTSLFDQWRQVEGYVRRFLATLQDEDLSRPVAFTLGSGREHVMPLGELMHHAANHGVHHRGQVALLLRSLGRAPGNFDILFYYAESQPPA